MTVSELFGDMTNRFLEAEKNYYSKVRSCKAQVQSVNNNYMVMKTKRGVIGQNILLIFIFFVAMYALSCAVPHISESTLKIFAGVLVFVCFSLMIIAPIFNYIRSRVKHKKQIKAADIWWEQVGRKQIVELNDSINSLLADANNLLAANPLNECLKGSSLYNSQDCYKMYLLSSSYPSFSVDEVIKSYYQKLIMEMEREEERERHQELMDAVSSLNEEISEHNREMEALGRQAAFDRGIIEMQLHDIKYK